MTPHSICFSLCCSIVCCSQFFKKKKRVSQSHKTLNNKKKSYILDFEKLTSAHDNQQKFGACTCSKGDLLRTTGMALGMKGGFW